MTALRKSAANNAEIQGRHAMGGARRMITPGELAAMQMALNLARHCRCAVFPASAEGAPLVPLNAASQHNLMVSNLWLRTPGTQVGVATGSVWALSVTPAAADWWGAYHARMPATRTYAREDGGLDLLFLAPDRAPGTIAPGVSVIADGGYVVLVPGMTCLDENAPAAWPGWLGAGVAP